jgi:hypothetical protein
MAVKPEAGLKSATYSDGFLPGEVRDFAQAVCASDLSSVPLTYLTRMRRGEFEILQRIAIELSSVLHAEQEYELHGRMQPGQPLRYETELAQVYEKSGSQASLLFLVFLTRIALEGGDLSAPLATSKTTMVIRRMRG